MSRPARRMASWFLVPVLLIGMQVACGDQDGVEVREAAQAEDLHASPSALPRLVDIGRGTCVPCKKMAPILEELAKTYAGRATIEVIDLREQPDAAREYGVRLIPTQIFYDREGREVWRHEGFLPRDEIVLKLREIGVPEI